MSEDSLPCLVQGGPLLVVSIGYFSPLKRFFPPGTQFHGQLIGLVALFITSRGPTLCIYLHLVSLGGKCTLKVIIRFFDQRLFSK